jgi:hypothetical protein
MNTFSKEYQEHPVFPDLDQYYQFYKDISFSIMGFVTKGTKSILNIDTYVFSSMQGTINSIRLLLKNGRLNDAYSLLRKYHDSSIINIYSGLYLEDNVNVDNFIVEKIDNWLNGKEQLPEYRIMSQYVRASKKLKQITDLLYKDDRYKKIRNRCNDNAHYNFYYNVLLNDNEIHLPYRLKVLNQFSSDIRNIFILHCSYLFFANEHYMCSSDYVDSLDCGLTPQEGSQYWVATFIQEAFDKITKKHRPDIAHVILTNTCMKLV